MVRWLPDPGRAQGLGWSLKEIARMSKKPLKDTNKAPLVLELHGSGSVVAIVGRSWNGRDVSRSSRVLGVAPLFRRRTAVP